MAFVCGNRALARTRADFRLLSALVRESRTSVDQLEQWWSKQRLRLEQAEKERQRLQNELTSFHAAESYRTAHSDPDGLRKVLRSLPQLDDSARAFAAAFTSNPKAIALLFSTETASVMLAVSEDSGWDAAQRLREAVATFGGKGGGSARLAQGMVPRHHLDGFLRALGFSN
jgi:alanyl-tRNA synthetase